MFSVQCSVFSVQCSVFSVQCSAEFRCAELRASKIHLHWKPCVNRTEWAINTPPPLLPHMALKDFKIPLNQDFTPIKYLCLMCFFYDFRVMLV